MIKKEELENILNSIIMRKFNSMKLNKGKVRCKEPGCTNEVSKNHSIQNHLIENIQEDGHVICSNHGLISKENFKDFNLITRNSVSCFKSFCPHHDKLLFRPIDYKYHTYFNNSQKEIETFFLRNLYNEIWNKEDALKKWEEIISFLDLYNYWNGPLIHKQENYGNDQMEVFNRMVHKYNDIFENFQDFFACDKEEAMYLFLTKDIFLETLLKMLKLTDLKFNLNSVENVKNKFLTNKNLLKYFVHELPHKKANIAATGLSLPYFDFKNNQINNFQEERRNLKYVSINILPFKNKTIILFIYEDEIYDSFFSFIKGKDPKYITNMLTQFILINTETFLLRPSFWDNLTDEDRDTVKNLLYSSSFNQEKSRFTDNFSVNLF